MKKFVDFGSIEQFSNVSRSLRTWATHSETTVEPFEVTGTVKVHGTNMGIGYWGDGQVTWQTRNSVLTPTDTDGFGMGFFIGQLGTDNVAEMLKPLIKDARGVVVYGEFFGKGIQKNVGVSELNKSFMAFGIIRVYDDVDSDGNHCWKREHVDINSIHSIPEKNFYRNVDFKQFSFKVDVYDQDMFDHLMDITLNEVEDVCPVASAIKEDLECTTGEGIVWRGVARLANGMERFVTFKVKGDKHKRGKGSAKVKKSVQYTDEQNDALSKFYNVALTIDRLEQGFEYLQQVGKDISMKSTGDYIKWVITDIQKEHANDVVDILYPVELQWNDALKGITGTARDYYLNKVRSL